MKKQVVISGFALKNSREIREIGATASLYVHEKSGAQLFHLACDDDNKVFSIAFKTIPANSTGVAHILEHCVLNGSKNYPARSTFMELVKGSMHTFINAMTGSDMTIYPVASTNGKDFVNLMRVYLDAVFFPMVYEQPEIFYQEGWHHELKDPGGELAVRGVVYNEMKGAFSSPDSIIHRFSRQAQFPDNTYAFESGGDPASIPELGYGEFLDFHRTHYHPSNSMIYLYGDMDLEATLKLIDGEYLSKFEDKGIRLEIPAQKPFAKVRKLECEYPVDENKDPSDQYHLSLTWTHGSLPDAQLAGDLTILADILMWTPASPLKKAIMESGLARDATCHVHADMKQPTLSIVCKQMRKEDIPALEKLIHAELKRLVKEGIDKRLIEGVVNSREFHLREASMGNMPRGLFYNWSSCSQWLHGGDPAEALAFEPLLEGFRRGLGEPYFEGLIEQALLKNHHASQITFVPVPGLVARQDAELKEKLAGVKAKLGQQEAEELVKLNQRLQEYQAEPVSEADLLKIPVLSLEDLDPAARQYPLEREAWREFTLLKHPLQTNGIVYLKAYFDLAHAEEEDLPWLSLYSYLTGMVDSQNHSYSELSKEIDIHTGGIALSLSILNSYQEPDEIMPKFVVSGKAVAAKSAKLMELAAEYALKPVFTDTARLKTVILEQKAKLEAQLLRGGMMVAINRMFAPFSALHHYQDLAFGLGYYHFLCDLATRLDKGMAEIVEELEWVRQTFFTQRNLVISLTAGEEEIAQAFQFLRPVVANISTEAYAPVEHHVRFENLNEGILAPVQVQFCVQGGNFFRKGYSYSGRLRVLNNILSNDYLYREIREKGGAYGAFSGFSLGGYMYFASFRDPNLRETLEVYDGAADYLRSFDCSRRELDKYVIGEISNLDYPKTPENMGAQADEDHLTGFTQADRQQIRDELLSTKVEDIRACADMIGAITSKKHYCVFGSEQKVKEAQELFDRLTPLFK
jgi:Zn-dependent M16 (insulinase) family peptidase